MKINCRKYKSKNYEYETWCWLTAVDGFHNCLLGYSATPWRRSARGVAAIGSPDGGGEGHCRWHQALLVDRTGSKDVSRSQLVLCKRVSHKVLLKSMVKICSSLDCMRVKYQLWNETDPKTRGALKHKSAPQRAATNVSAHARYSTLHAILLSPPGRPSTEPTMPSWQMKCYKDTLERLTHFRKAQYLFNLKRIPFF